MQKWISKYFGIEGLLDGSSALNFGLSSFDLRRNAVNVLQLMEALPKYGADLHHFIRRFT